MTEIQLFFQKLFTVIIKLTLWVIMAVVAAFLLMVALVLLLLGVLWALIRGRKPVPPVFVGRFHQFTTQRVWPGGTRRPSSTERDEVVDVEVREVGGSPRVEDQREPREPRQPD